MGVSGAIFSRTKRQKSRRTAHCSGVTSCTTIRGLKANPNWCRARWTVVRWTVTWNLSARRAASSSSLKSPWASVISSIAAIISGVSFGLLPRRFATHCPLGVFTARFTCSCPTPFTDLISRTLDPLRAISRISSSKRVMYFSIHVAQGRHLSVLRNPPGSIRSQSLFSFCKRPFSLHFLLNTSN